jgi:tetratricopeptide (TPR) repeat protein
MPKYKIVIVGSLVVITLVFLFYRTKNSKTKYTFDKGETITLPWAFQIEEAKICNDEASELKFSGKYEKAIEAYKSCLSIEDNPNLLFELATCYMYNNELEKAIKTINKGIVMDSTFSSWYSNRGLMNYKLVRNEQAISDYLKAIELGSSHYSTYANLALTYYYEEQYNEACESIGKAEERGLELSSYQKLTDISEEYCK